MPLAPYPQKPWTHEIKTIITEYSAMIGRVNELFHMLKTKELMLRGAQIKRLQSQLNPHFFYGTLEKHPHDCGDQRSGDHRGNRLFLREYDARFVLVGLLRLPLVQEIDIANQYMDIQRKRLGGRFSFAWAVQVTVEAWWCPKFILFSLVGNIFTHDVSHSRCPVKSLAASGVGLLVWFEQNSLAAGYCCSDHAQRKNVAAAGSRL